MQFGEAYERFLGRSLCSKPERHLVFIVDDSVHDLELLCDNWLIIMLTLAESGKDFDVAGLVGYILLFWLLVGHSLEQVEPPIDLLMLGVLLRQVLVDSLVT